MWYVPCFQRLKSSLSVNGITLSGLWYTLSRMEFEWDDEKAAINLTDHKVSFGEAKTVLDDPLYVDFYDPDHSYEELRYLVVGE